MIVLTAIDSRNRFANTLKELAAKKTLEKITTEEIVKAAGVSRQTFYSLFQSKENVITFALRNDCCYSAMVQDSGCSYSFQQICGKFTGFQQNFSITGMICSA